MSGAVTLTNDMIDTLLSNASLVALVPCLQHVRELPAANCCGGGRATLDYQHIKDCIALTDNASIQLIRHALHAAKLVVYRVTTKNGVRGLVKHTRA